MKLLEQAAADEARAKEMEAISQEALDAANAAGYEQAQAELAAEEAKQAQAEAQA